MFLSHEVVREELVHEALCIRLVAADRVFAAAVARISRYLGDPALHCRRKVTQHDVGKLLARESLAEGLQPAEKRCGTLRAVEVRKLAAPAAVVARPVALFLAEGLSEMGKHELAAALEVVLAEIHHPL